MDLIFEVKAKEPTPHQLGGLGSAVSSPSSVRGGAPENLKFFYNLRPQKSLQCIARVSSNVRG